MDDCQRKAFIIYTRYYDFEENRIPAGGVQTYIENLIPLLIEAGYECRVVQAEESECFKKKKLKNCTVEGVAKSEKQGSCFTEVILNYIWKDFNNDKDLLIFADHILTVQNQAKHSIGIQHGIHWDVPKEKSRGNFHMFLSKVRFAYNEYRRLEYVKHIVCVDYNFVNWYRTQVDVPKCCFTVIPNFTKISELNCKSNNVVKIIFARRFVPHRGTKVFAEAIRWILSEYENVEVTMAGRGSDEQYLREQLKPWENKVKFIHYRGEDSLLIHKDKHIAVVPTVGSEGTSLSLLEAMSAQCAVICTDVGGMTNIVLNNYNGKMVPAGNAEKLHWAIRELIDDPKKRERLALAGYETVKYAFSYEQWADCWRKIIKESEDL